MNRNQKLTKLMAAAMAGVLVVQPAMLCAAEKEKEETVYVKTDANGVPDEVIVSDWLKNADGSATITDRSDLEGIENVKGEETFSQDGEKLIWDAAGSDIYYQGTTAKELPVSVKAEYYLDGKKISPRELAGKSGHVKICYTYENKSRKGTVYTPFLMVTGMILPTEGFKNTEVKNGRLISDGEKEIVIGIGLPGLAKSLELENTEALKDLEIPESFELEADVTDFHLTMAMTVATTPDLDGLNLDKIEGADDLRDAIKELTDAATQLVDGSGELSDGVQTLKESCVELLDGMNAVDENMGTLSDGIGTLNDRKNELIDGIHTLASGIQALENKKGALVNGMGDLASGSASLKSGAKKLASGSSQLAESSVLLQAGAKELAGGEGSKKLQSGAKSLSAGSSQLAAGTKTLSEGLNGLLESEESRQLLTGGAALAQGSEEVKNKIADYTAGAEGVSAGTAGYIGSVEQYVGAVNQTLEGILNTQSFRAESEHTEAQTMQMTEPETTQQTVLAIDASAVANMESVLSKLQGVKSAIDGAKKPEDLLALYASYGEYCAQLDECISQMNSALGSVQEESFTTVVSSEAGSFETDTAGNNGTGDAAGSQSGAADAIEELLQAGNNLTPGGNAEVAKLQAGAEALITPDGENGTKGAQLLAGASSVADGAAAVSSGIGQVFTAVKEQLQPGIGALVTGAAALESGTKALETGLGQLFGGAGALEKNLEKFAAAAGSLAAGNAQLYSGSKDLAAGAGKLNSGAAVLSSVIGQLAAGGSRLESGADELGGGMEALAAGSSELKDGTAKLAEGGSKLDEGVNELAEGAVTLADGMEEFNGEGIEKITDFLEGDVQAMVDRLKAVKDAGEAYKLFSESGADVNGRVKFIIETGGIEKE